MSKYQTAINWLVLSGWSTHPKTHSLYLSPLSPAATNFLFYGEYGTLWLQYIILNGNYSTCYIFFSLSLYLSLLNCIGTLFWIIEATIQLVATVKYEE